MNRHDDILLAAQRLFAHHGLKKVTTDDIAREARVSKTTIYSLYCNKQEILADVVRKEMDILLIRIRTAVAAESTVEGRMRAHLLTKIRIVHELINLNNLTRESLAEYWDQAHELRVQFVREEARLLEEILTGGINAGELVVADVTATARYLVVSLQALEYPWAIEGLGVAVEDQVEHMLTLLLDGMRRR